MAKKITGKGPRAAALRILDRVAASDAYADILLEKELRGLKGPDRALATELVNGVLRWQIKIDWIIDSFSKIKTTRLEHSVLNALRLGVYQLLFLTKIPPHAAINETVELLRRGGRRKAGFVNAVLRMVDAGRYSITFPVISKEPVKYISIVFSHPEWMVRRWIERFGVKETLELAQANLRVPPKALRVNTLVTTKEALLDELKSKGINVRPLKYSPDGIEVVDTGGERLEPLSSKYYIQDEASQLIAHLMSPAPGETILDSCAAPGGKTTHMAQLMENRGFILAVDKYRARLRDLERTAERLGVKIIRTMEADATGPVALQPSLLEEVAAPYEDGFNGVLVDAPCSGLGILRRRPDIKLKRVEEDIRRLSELQKRLIQNLARNVRKGGRLVYSVCTFEPEETVEVIENFLDRRKDFILEDASEYLPPGCRPLVDKRGLLLTLPHRHSTDGFFAARLKRVS